MRYDIKNLCNGIFEIPKERDRINYYDFITNKEIKKITCYGVLTSIDQNGFSKYNLDNMVFRADEMPLFAFPDKLIPAACKGFAEAYFEEAKIDELVFEENLDFIKSHKRKIMEFVLSSEPLLNLMIKEKILTKKDTLKLIDKSIELDKNQMTILLVDYSQSAKSNNEYKL